MLQQLRRLFYQVGLGMVLVSLCWLGAIAPAHSFNNPELLPAEPTNVVDLAQILTPVQKERLDSELAEFEAQTGWKLRVLTQYDRTPGLAVRDFWDLDDRSILLVADTRGGNLLNFNVGDTAYRVLQRTFWVELQTRFGNQYFVRDNGEDQAILQSLHAIETCLAQGGCRAVPGLPQEQWILTLATSIFGGIILGFVARPRRADQKVAWTWILLFSPLWGMLFFAFGLGPVVVRTQEWLPVLRNVAGFALGAIVAFLIPAPSEPPPVLEE
ncbi:TPM domain-containing protein [Thermosynechococcus sp. HY213]|uniref:TPM domain-containing protein n=1 Tax=unclassified Thermosynechococcus TaxID=2622553 RepID=UPI002861A2B4|nr:MULTISPECIES: TPM domain-containing protein [unclassified Thermosynechococcus]MDR5638627.1 TPM domain-containing protein [Thermosynechococcus sp. PP42]MDR7921444.1 TPM domain-containing protein [Thermosynechococcus sp. HY213]